MKRKIGTLIDEGLFRRGKEMAARKGLAFNELIEKALEKYLEMDAEGGFLSLEDVLDADQASHATEGSGRGAGEVE